jgi:hypothetical protein
MVPINARVNIVDYPHGGSEEAKAEDRGPSSRLEHVTYLGMMPVTEIPEPAFHLRFLFRTIAPGRSFTSNAPKRNLRTSHC